MGKHFAWTLEILDGDFPDALSDDTTPTLRAPSHCPPNHPSPLSPTRPLSKPSPNRSRPCRMTLSPPSTSPRPHSHHPLRIIGARVYGHTTTPLPTAPPYHPAPPILHPSPIKTVAPIGRDLFRSLYDPSLPPYFPPHSHYPPLSQMRRSMWSYNYGRA